MSNNRDRRRFLASVAADAVAGRGLRSFTVTPKCRAGEGQAVRTRTGHDGDGIVIHYKEPFDFGMMQGPTITDANSKDPHSILQDHNKRQTMADPTALLKDDNLVALDDALSRIRGARSLPFGEQRRVC